MKTSATGLAREASNSTVLQLLARLGFAVNGLLHILIGVIAITVAIGAGGGSADQSGALGQLASSPGGVFLLWTVVVGLFALGLWLIISAFIMRGDPKRKWSRRLTNLAKAIVYFAIGATALTFATSHPESVQALFKEAQKHQLRLITGKCLQDRNSPDGVRDETEQSLLDTEALIQQWHGVDRLGYAITPRFAPSCSDAQMRGAGELAAKYPDVWIQSHVAENLDEVRWVKELYPQSRSYLQVYEDFGLLRERAVYAHCIHFDAADRALMARSGAAAAVSPTSNLFLGSGFFDYKAADEAANGAGFAYGLASDVGGGTSFSPFHTMLAAYYVGRAAVQQGGALKAGLSLSPQNLWWQHTAGAAKALGLEGVVGNLAVGCEADFVVLNPAATPLLARRTARATSLDELLFAMIVLGDDRLIETTVISESNS